MKQFRLILISWFSCCMLLHASYADAKKTEEETYQQIVLNEVNRYRASRGLKPLKLNSFISQVARQHSLDMANKTIEFGHKHFNDRIKRIYNHLEFCEAGAENIAYFKIPPREVVRKWLTSRGHRRNIEGNYNLTGIGIVRTKAGWVYYTQIFLRTADKKNNK
ncbi:CAP domain-containing protein [Legionella londiniensis]|uniref:Putative transporter n=1 Tax=Legionella londiniensis TaxID=45068 RepID=A0A0W0VQW2_9GAMM|nr:CAP domain-containing protein [Legionella londiniensis]KTD22551.1 putative transporter [Legionella londiniensis]STX92482.1 putative transporter [Legionella londiniensis]